MSAMCEVPVRVVDELPGVECRVAFLSAACQALCEQPELARGSRGRHGKVCSTGRWILKPCSAS